MVNQELWELYRHGERWEREPIMGVWGSVELRAGSGGIDAATGKARSPRVRRRVIGTSSAAFVRLLLIFTALVVSKVDYCCSVLAGVSGHLLDRLQSILNPTILPVF